MPSIRAFGGIALAAAMLAGCTPDTSRTASPLVGSTGTVQDQLRQQQLANAPSRTATGGGSVTAINPGTTGIERNFDGTTGGVGGAVAGLNTTGTVNRPGVGAPDTQSMPSTSQTARQKRRAAERAAAASRWRRRHGRPSTNGLRKG